MAGVSGVNNTNTQSYSTTKPKNTDKTGDKDFKEVQDSKEKESDKVKPGSYNDPKRRPGGVFTDEQLEFLEGLKDDPDNQRLVDNQAMGKDQFMHILLRQLSNQDPLSPMEDKDFIGQMAQFSSLEGMQKLNENFESLKGDVASISSIVGKSTSTDAAIIKMNMLLEKIAEKLGVKLEEETEEATEADASQKVDATEESEKLAEAGGTEETEKEEVAENTEKPSEEVNKETQKQKADKAYKDA